MNIADIVRIFLLLLDLLFWGWADLRLRPLRHGKPIRAILALVVASQFLMLLWWMVFPDMLGRQSRQFWLYYTTWLYMWHLLLLPATMAILAVWYAGKLGIWGVLRLARHRRHPARVPSTDPAVSQIDSPVPAPVPLSRRQVLAAAAAVTPLLAQVGGLVASANQVGRFRIQPLTVPIPDLPRELEGLTIAHISDTHAGKFINEPQLADIVAAVRKMDPQLIAFTGDLIDHSLGELPMSLDAMLKLRRIAPMGICPGNHDLFVKPWEFRGRTRAALPDAFLANTSHIHKINGCEVELMGLDYGLGNNAHQPNFDGHMDMLLRNCPAGPGRFRILLSHHPHAFDRAALTGIPLTLAGHTHGGQLMLTKEIGCGRIYRYWSGLYRKPNASLVVSNGVGNWFPLRINAPAEIVQIKLTRATKG